MQIPIHATLAVATLCGVIGVCAPVAAQPLDQLSWLAGCWAAEGGEPGSLEHWMPLAGGTMLGVARTVKNGKTVAHEFMQIREVAPGQIVYLAMPSGRTATPFALKRQAAGEVVFENLEHDFPQRVMYRQQANGGLLARIEGTRDGALRGIDFPLRRVSCDSALMGPAGP